MMRGLGNDRNRRVELEDVTTDQSRWRNRDGGVTVVGAQTRGDAT
jgi:hypothetical protein